jgi:multidrug efflux pump subunit AcrA (membrane-fusion protein)
VALRYFGTKVLLLCIACAVIGCGRTDVAPTTVSSVPAFTANDLTFVVQRGRVVRTATFSGRISPIEEVLLYFKTSGYVKKVYARPGDRVKAGDLVAELEADDLRNQIAQAEVALDSARLRLSTAEMSLQQEIAVAELDLAVAQARLAGAEGNNLAAIAQAELSLSLAQEELARIKAQATYAADIVSARVGLEQAADVVKRAEIAYKEALDRPWEPQEVRDAHARELQQARWNLEIAQAQYDQAIADGKVYQHNVNIREIAVKWARAELEQLKMGVDPLLALEVQRAQQELEWLKEGVDPALVNEVNQAQLALERLQGRLADAQIVAPVDGEVVFLSLYSGRSVEPFKTVAVIADPSAIEASADLSGDRLTGLTEGQGATVFLSADIDRAWNGTVRCLPYPYGTCGSTESLAESTQSVRISLEDETGGLKIGDLIQVTVVLEEKDDALWLPPPAVQTLQGQRFVIVQEGSRQRRVNVELGTEGQDRVEITRGLEEGQVIVAP